MRLVGEQLACERGGRRVFADIGFALAPGEMLVLRGPNGAGKTSLLRMIAGLVEPAAGALRLEGADDDPEPGRHAHLVAHQDALKPALTVEENLSFWARFMGGDRVDAALAAYGLDPLAHYAAALLSAGQKRRLTLARLLVAPRRIWLLDEPSVGLDAQSHGTLRRHMHDHLESGGLIVAATHVELGLPETHVVNFADRR